MSKENKANKADEETRGRKSMWDKLDMPSRFDDIERWCRDGVIERDICTKLGVSEVTFNKWKHDYASIVEVLKRGKAISDAVVVSKLYARAVGYEYDEVRTETIVTETGIELNVLKETITKKHVLPDVTAQIFWLKNRMSNDWRDKHEIGGELEFTGIIATRQRVEEGINRLLAGIEDSRNGREVKTTPRLGTGSEK